VRSGFKKVSALLRKDFLLLSERGYLWILSGLAVSLALLTLGVSPSGYVLLTFFPLFAFSHEVFELERGRERLFAYYFRNPVYYFLSKFFLIFAYGITVDVLSALLLFFREPSWRESVWLLLLFFPFQALLQALAFTVAGVVRCGTVSVAAFSFASLLLTGLTGVLILRGCEAALSGEVPAVLSISGLALITAILFFLSLSANKRSI